MFKNIVQEANKRRRIKFKPQNFTRSHSRENQSPRHIPNIPIPLILPNPMFLPDMIHQTLLPLTNRIPLPMFRAQITRKPTALSMALDEKPRRQQITLILHLLLPAPLVDCNNLLIHPPRPALRDFYRIEQMRVAIRADARRGQGGIERLAGLLQVSCVLAVDGVVVG